MDRLWEKWQDGGWGMWPILVFGLLAVIAAARFAWRGEHDITAFIRWMLATVGASALLGFTTGMQAVFNFIRREQTPEVTQVTDWRIRVLFEGTKEASNTLSLGFILITLTCLLLAVGYRRFPPSQAA
jgi:hypothetical protein